MGILRSDVVSHSQLEPTGSVLFDGNSDYLSWSNTDLKLGTSDFTLEAWIYVVDENSGDLHQTIFMAGDSSDAGEMVLQVGANNAGTLGQGAARELQIRVAGTGYFSYYQIEYGQWYHVACVRDSGMVAFFVDGVHTGRAISLTEDLTTAFTQIGYRDGSYNAYFNGYISNARIAFGALYKNNFTLSKFELENVAGTALLCCQSSTSATTAAVKPGAITANGTAAASAVIPDVKKDITDVGVVFGDNTKFDTLSYLVPPGGTSAESNRGRGVWAGGRNPADSATTDYIAIQSGGTAQDFGDLSQGRNELRGLSSSTRGIFGGGRYPHPSVVDTIDYITIATTSNATDFGNLTAARGAAAPVSNETRGVFIAGFTPSNSNTIDYVTIATAGNATDFGDALSAAQAMGSVMSTTRGCAAGSYPGSNVIEYITIGTTGNATDFGDLTVAGYSLSGTSSNTRGLFMGGEPGRVNVVDYITIATTGNATDFGDLIHNAIAQAAATGNRIRGVYGGGYTSPSLNNNMEYVTIATLGNALDYGDLSEARNQLGATSDSHGGLS